MASIDLEKQLRQQEPARPRLPGASNLVLIDNYDSFTYNVYQYLELEGASVTVYRNDEITLDQLISENPTQLVVSPGPGHPNKDAGISTEAIKYFAGRIPIFGVCMGEQCIISAFGGVVDVTGEILHGKTSPLVHDGKGVYKGITDIPVKLPVTRYHSLAGTHATIPSCLEVTSRIESGLDNGKGIIMGVRHKEYVVEGVQFHPESILSADGRQMFRNFLQMKGGMWSENPSSDVVVGANGVSAQSRQPTLKQESSSASQEKWQGQSILDTIFRNRSEQVAQQKLVPSQQPQDLERAYKLDIAPPLISFTNRVRQSRYPLSLLAEIKRASPSKGEIAMHISAPEQARKYALAGASVISVLTEPTWFKGSIDDLRAVRAVLNGMPNRPAILRKEFIFDEYQILEARLAGADTVLLIVKMLDDALLSKLYNYSKSLGMEPLVEVNTAEEMRKAIALGSKVIGVNNRNLANFEVDLGTTSRLMDGVPEGTFVCALSGISGPQDVEAYRSNRVGGVLIGEALMRSANVSQWVSQLMGSESAPLAEQEELLVKICGTRTPEAAKVAIEAGADMIGMILVEGRSRFVAPKTAIEISSVVHSTPRPKRILDPKPILTATADDYFQQATYSLYNPRRALLVGVFQNHTLIHVLNCVKEFDLDIVQLHGSEPMEWASVIPVPVIRRFGPSDAGLATRGFHTLPLIDAAAGGTGQVSEPALLRNKLENDGALRVMLAGGLNPGNVSQVLSTYGRGHGGIVAVDTSSGVETGGKQDLDKIRRFVTEAKSV